MTASTMHATRQRRFPRLVVLGVIAGLGWLWLQLPPMPNNHHAVQQHGNAARSAYTYVSRCDPDKLPAGWYECSVQDDGREVHTLELQKRRGRPKAWAIVIIGGIGAVAGKHVVTAWITMSRRQVERKRGKV